MSLRNYLKNKGISNYKLSKNAHVSESTVSQFINGKRDVTLNTACKIADALDIALDELRIIAKGEKDNECKSSDQSW